MFEQFTKLTAMTAAEIVEQSRRVSTAALTYVPHEETKDALAKAINLQCNLADIYAAQMDKVAAEFKKAWAFPV